MIEPLKVNYMGQQGEGVNEKGAINAPDSMRKKKKSMGQNEVLQGASMHMQEKALSLDTMQPEPKKGDTVELSKEGKALAAGNLEAKRIESDMTEAEEEVDADPTEKQIQQIKEKITKLQEEIEAIQKSDLSAEEKTLQLQAKQMEMETLNAQLLDLVDPKDK